jgi:DNA-binding NtrC family response regulator
MAADVLVLVADEALRTVLEITLQMDDYAVRTAATAEGALDVLVATKPSLLILDATMDLGDSPIQWAARHAADIPLILLVSAWDAPPPLEHPDAVTLPMPFGRAELRRALAAAHPSTRHQL